MTPPTPILPVDGLNWTSFAEQAGYSLLLAVLIGGTVAIVSYLLLRVIARQQRPACNSCHNQPADPAATGAGAIGLAIGLLVLLLVPAMYRQGDNKSNVTNSGTAAEETTEQIDQLTEQVKKHMTARVVAMGFRNVDNIDVEAETLTVEFGTCSELTLDLSETDATYFVIGDPPVVERFETIHPLPSLRDALADEGHPLRRCLTQQQLAAA